MKLVDLNKFNPIDASHFEKDKESLTFEDEIFLKVLESFNSILISYQKEKKSSNLLIPFENM